MAFLWVSAAEPVKDVSSVSLLMSYFLWACKSICAKNLYNVENEQKLLLQVQTTQIAGHHKLF